MKGKGKKEGGGAGVFLMMACQYANVEGILTIMQQWIQTKLIFTKAIFVPREGLMNARQALYHRGISSASGKIYQSIVKL